MNVNATTAAGAQADAANILTAFPMPHFTPEPLAVWRRQPHRRFAIQHAWDLRREIRRPGARIEELDDEQWANLCDFLDPHPDEGELDDEQWANLCGAAERHDAKVRKQAEAEIATAKAASARNDFLKALFANTTGPVYTCSFTNERGAGPEKHTITRNAGAITNFLIKWDKPGRGAFICVGTLKDGAQRRAKENIAETIGLHADIDFKNVDGLGADPKAGTLRQLARLKYQPSIVVFSGGGLHAYWLFKEPVETQGNIERIEAALKQLADVVAGDLQVCEVARVMRMPGSHNTKNGAWIRVEVLEHVDRRFELDDLEEWLSEQSPVMLRKKREQGRTVGEIADDDFFARFAKEHGIKPPIDVEKRLANMMYMGLEHSSIHWTQIQCGASMLSSGVPIDDVVAILLAATRVAAGEYAPRWNWKREERSIRRDCEDWIKKHPEIKERQQREAKPKLESIEGGKAEAKVPEPSQATAVSGANVIKLAVPPKAGELHIGLGKAVLAYMEQNGEKLINTKDGPWFYAKGVWELRIDPGWLNVRIETSCAAMGFKTNTKLINESRNWILRQPDVWRDADLPWDQHGKIPTRSGLIDPKTGALEPAKAEHFCTWRIDAEYDPDAKCEWWETMIADMFGDKPMAEQAALVSVVQECMGAALIDRKPRSLSKALVFYGLENRAKSGVLDVVTGLFGVKPITVPIKSVESTHGLMPFIRRAPWVLHEAFGGEWHFASVTKSIITQEEVGINIKNGPLITTIIRSPVFWATNHAPQFKEATRAIVSRMITIEVTRQFHDDKPIGAAAEALRRGFAKPGALVVATELPGVLNWAIAGLRRALERGSIASTESIKATADAIHRDSNLVAGFLEECISFDPMARLRVSDFCLAHSAWFVAEKGESRTPPSNDSIGRAMKAIGDPRIGMHVKEMRNKTNRFYCGIALNKAGLRYHKTAFESRMFEGKIATTTSPEKDVNSLIPASWDERPSVIAMRVHHADKAKGTSSNSEAERIFDEDADDDE